MGDKVVSNLCEVMRVNNSICFLNLRYDMPFLCLYYASQNKITDEGAKALAEVLRLNTKLNVLFMRWN
jgi:hypothetical protein